MIGYFCAVACAALSILPGGTVTLRAVYVDDETPHQCQVVAQDRKRFPLVIAGVAWGDRRRCPGALNALEWYPFIGSYDWLGPPPCGWDAYILQDRFAWSPSPPPTPGQRASLLAQARRCDPQLILWY